MTSRLPMDGARESEHAEVMDGTGLSGDEVSGVLALRALLAAKRLG